MNPIEKDLKNYYGTSSDSDILEHYGTKRHSGRYPWGSGDNPYQHSGDFLSRVETLKKNGMPQSSASICTARRQTFRCRGSAWSGCMPTRTDCWATPVAAAFTSPVLDAPTAGCMWTCAKPRADGRGERRWKASLPPSSAVL